MSDVKSTPVQEMFNVGKSFMLPVGTPLQVEIEGVTVKLNSMSLGLFPEQYIIIKYPYGHNIGALDHKLCRGNRVSVRYLNGGAIWGFLSDVIGVSTDPVRVVFIELPSAIVRHNLRQATRVACSLPAEICGMAGVDNGIIPDIVHSGIVFDISLCGCAFNMGIPSAGQRLPDIKMNESVTLALQMPGIEKKFDLSGEVRRMDRDAQKMNIGICFYEIDEQTHHALTEFILAVEKFG